MYRDILIEKKKIMGWTTEELSRRSGVPVGTINKILSGETTSPRYDTMNALEQAFEMAEELPRTLKMIREPSVAYSASSHYRPMTLDDYYRQPIERRCELIDGVFYDMASPSSAHQTAVSELVFQFYSHIRSHKGSCNVFPAPLDVQLNCDDYTMVQPDFLVVCDKEKIHSDRIFGAPDFIAEVLSPSSKKLDTGTKLLKYVQAGVKEYWIIDPQGERVVCYYFPEDGLMPRIFPLSAEIPVKIYDDKLKITLAN
ncbi:MAG: Uma2 family endonuclease [Lachnospiraceae bacterium]|nr:Uma2 family endonuclease [Lachnospiraceae bacterium]